MDHPSVLSSLKLPQRQRKPATYGKSHRSTSYSLQKEEGALVAQSSSSAPRKPSPLTGPFDVPKSQSGKLVRPSPKRTTATTLSVFDVPSSDDEGEAAPTITSPRAQEVTGSQNKLKVSAAKRGISQSRQDGLSDSSNPSNKRKRPTPTPPPPADRPQTQIQEIKPKIKPTASTDAHRPQPHKLVNTDVPKKVAEPAIKPHRSILPPSSRKKEGGALEARPPKPASTARSLVAKSISAPASLTHMLKEIEHAPEDRHTRNELPTIPSTPPRKESSPMSISDTPPRGQLKQSASSRKAPMTPRQNQLWNRLLDDSEVNTDTPNSLGVGNLSIADSGVRPTFKPPSIVRSSSDIPESSHKRRKRLIDTLKQSTPIKEVPGEYADFNDDDDDSSETGSDSSDNESEISNEVPVEKPNEGAVLPKNAGPKVTYASQRTYLASNSLEADLMLDIPFDQPPATSQWAAGSPTAPTASQGLFPEDDPEESQGAMKSARELRLAGMATGVSLEIQNWIDDIEGRNGSSMAGKRSAMIELCTKLADEEVIARLTESGLDQLLIRTWASATDTILQFCIAVAVTFLSESKRVSVATAKEIARITILPMLTPLVPIDTDMNRIARDRKTNMSKVAQKSIQEFCTTVQKTLWPEERPQIISPRAVALKALDSITRRLRADGNTDAIMSDGLIADLLRIVSPPIPALMAGTPTNTVNMELALSVLEAGSISRAPAQGMTWSTASLRQLAEMLGSLLSTTGAVGSRIQILALKLTLNLTNNSPKICDLFASPLTVRHIINSIDTHFKMIKNDMAEEERDMTRDNLLLSLGAMFNLAECSEKARLSVMTDGEGLIDSLVRCFLEGLEQADQAESVEASHTNVAYGYLAVLLGNLCLDGQVRTAAAARLPEGRLDSLIQAMDKFILYHQKVDMEAFEGEEGGEVYASFTGRLRAVVDRLRQAAL